MATSGRDVLDVLQDVTFLRAGRNWFTPPRMPERPRKWSARPAFLRFACVSSASLGQVRLG